MAQGKDHEELVSIHVCVCMHGVELSESTFVDIPVKIVKEAEQIEAELDEALLLVLSQCAEDLCGIKHVLSVHDPFDGRAKNENES